MNPYYLMKDLLEVVDRIGMVRKVSLHEKGKYVPEGISITGDTRDGKVFTLEFEIVDKEDGNAEELE